MAAPTPCPQCPPGGRATLAARPTRGPLATHADFDPEAAGFDDGRLLNAGDDEELYDAAAAKPTR
jgi:hypothetical protein